MISYMRMYSSKYDNKMMMEQNKIYEKKVYQSRNNIDQNNRGNENNKQE